MTDFVEALTALPKAELHVHLDGSVRPQTVLDLARVSGREPVARRAEEVVSAMGAGEIYDDLPGYLAVFSHTVPLLQTVPALRRVAQELIEDAARDGVHHIEVRFCPDLHTEGGLSHDGILEAVREGLAEGQRRLSVSFGIIVTALRSASPERSEALAHLAARWSQRSVVAFDLAGPEADFPCGDHRRAFDIAHEAQLGVTIHAGEVTGPETIAQAVELGAHRIGHGTHLRDDPALLEQVREQQIPLEMCPSSNVQTHSVAGFEDHPAVDYHRAGLAVTINTDSRLISNTRVTAELAHLREHHGLTWDEAKGMATASFRAAFLDDARKSELIERVEKMSDRLLASGFEPSSAPNGEDLPRVD